MTYYVGQPVLSAMSDDNTYVQETGPNQGEPVVRGIVTELTQGFGMNVWWENCDRPMYCLDEDLKDAG
jgi:hypothetical protein